MHLCPNAGLHETGQVRRLNMILSLGLAPIWEKGHGLVFLSSVGLTT